jgi:excisionase family DNA binding protein
MKQTENLDQPSGLPRMAYNIEETADMLGVSPGTIRRWIKRGWLKCSWASRRKLIPHSEIERFLKDTLE